MTKQLLALAAALSFSVAAQAQPSMGLPQTAQTIRVAAADPVQTPSAPAYQAPPAPQTIAPAPAPVPAQAAPQAPAYEPPPASYQPPAANYQPAAPAYQQPAPAYQQAAPAYQPPPPAPQPQGYRSASYRGGEGATWKTGRDAYGFSGTYGGCRYSGHAGRGGFSIDRVCR